MSKPETGLMVTYHGPRLEKDQGQQAFTMGLEVVDRTHSIHCDMITSWCRTELSPVFPCIQVGCP